MEPSPLVAELYTLLFHGATPSVVAYSPPGLTTQDRDKRSLSTCPNSRLSHYGHRQFGKSSVLWVVCYLQGMQPYEKGCESGLPISYISNRNLKKQSGNNGKK